LTIHTLDLPQELGLASLKILVAEPPVVGSFSFQLGVNADGIGVLDLAKGIKVELLEVGKRWNGSTYGYI
jgi:hypothetical protein